MQAVILAAGASTRFYPFEGKPKCMVPLLGRPILAHTIASLVKIGINELVIVTGKDSPISSSFGNGGRFGVKISYAIQEKPLGMGDALLQVGKMIKEDFLLLHGHHVDIEEFAALMMERKRTAEGVLLTEARENPWDYGVVGFDGDLIKEIVEKPKKGEEQSKICIVGIYLLTPTFLSFLEKVKLHHYQFEEALGKFAKTNNLKAVIAPRSTMSLKFPWDLFSLKNYLLSRLPHRISRGAKIGKGVILVGKMIIEEGATIYENAVIKGPAYIGRNVLVGNDALVREGTSLEEDSRVGAFSEIKDSIFFPHSSLGSGFIASSIIGENCRLAHGFISANRRFDRQTIKVKVKGNKVDTGLDDLGVIMGEGVQAGIGVGTMPGVTIGQKVKIGPGSFVFEDIEPGLNYYTQFKTVVKKI